MGESREKDPADILRTANLGQFLGKICGLAEREHRGLGIWSLKRDIKEWEPLQLFMESPENLGEPVFGT